MTLSFDINIMIGAEMKLKNLRRQERHDIIMAENRYTEIGEETMQEESYEEEDNDFSLVISMTYQEKSFLFAGDCEEVRLDELLSQTEFDLPHDVLKVPHHGKKEENSEEFFRAVEPEIAVITCSGEQPAGKKICAALENLGTEIYLTSDGTVTCMCDGETLQVLQE